MIDRVLSQFPLGSRELTPLLGTFLRWVKFSYETDQQLQEKYLEIVVGKVLPEMLLVGTDNEDQTDDQKEVQQKKHSAFEQEKYLDIYKKAARYIVAAKRSQRSDPQTILRQVLFEKTVAGRDGAYLMDVVSTILPSTTVTNNNMEHQHQQQNQKRTEDLYRYHSCYSLALRILEERQRIFF